MVTYTGCSRSSFFRDVHDLKDIVPLIFLSNKHCLIRHDSIFKTVWDWFILALVIHTAIEVPFDVAFLVPARKSEVSTSRFGSLMSLSPIAVANLFVDLFFITDIPINFRSAVVVKDTDEVKTDPKRIAILYLKSWFLVDFVAAIPFEFKVDPQQEGVSMRGYLHCLLRNSEWCCVCGESEIRNAFIKFELLRKTILKSAPQPSSQKSEM